MLDGRGDAVAQARPIPPVDQEAQELPRAPHHISDGAVICARFS